MTSRPVDLARWRRVAVVLVALAVIAASCSSSDSDGGTATTTTSPPSTTIASDDGATDGNDDAPPEINTVTAPDPDTTPIEVDDAVLIGTLDNGLTYYVQSNDSPGNQVNLRLVVRAGSRHEGIAGSGIAHFTEHMLFNGTEAYPSTELDKVLQGFGMQIGPDLNAYTSSDETVYILSIPTNNPEIVATGVEVLREWAGRAIIDPDDVVEERGVVREEFRLRRESPDGVIFTAFADVYDVDSPYLGAGPSGTEEGILGTTAEAVRSFYDLWYRPELMAVVAVGDLPVDQLEAMIVDQFADLQARAEAIPEPDNDAPVIDDQVVDVVTHPEGPEPFISLDYSLPNWNAGTIGGERLLVMERVIGIMLRNSLDEGSVRGTIPIVRPTAGPFTWNRARRFMGFNVLASDGEAAALEGLVGELERRFRSGFTSDELQRAVDEVQGGLDQWLDSIGTVQDTEVADELVEHFLSGTAIDSPENTHARQSAILAELSPTDITDHYRYTYEVSANLVLVVGSDPAELPTVAELEAAIDAAVDAAGDDTAVPDDRDTPEVGTIMNPPEPITGERTEIRSLDAVRVSFDNGATVIFAPSLITEDQVFMLARSQGGWSTLAPGDAPYASLAAFAASQSGVGDLDAIDLDIALTGAVVSVTPYIDETAEGFVGNAAASDVELMFQLLHQRIVAPRIDEAGWREAVEQGRSQARSLEVDPNSAAFAALLEERYQNDPYQIAFPTQERLDTMTAADAAALYNARLDDVDDLVVAIVGDIDRKVIIGLAERYLATLPAGDSDTWEDHSPEPPAGVVTRTVGAGANDAGAGITMLYSLERDTNDRAEATALMLQTVVNTRLFETVREELGASYAGGQLFIQHVDAPDTYIEAFVVADGDPERLDEIHRTIVGELEDIARNGITDDEFERALAVVLGDLDFVSNDDYLTQLLSHVERGADDALTLLGRYQAATGLTPGEIGALAADLFGRGDRIEIFRAPS